MKRNWKTTLGGICMILSGVAGLGLNVADMGTTPMELSFGAITGGIALIMARDAGTGSDAPE